MLLCDVCLNRFGVQKEAERVTIDLLGDNVAYDFCKDHKILLLDNIALVLGVMTRKKEFSDAELLELGNKIRGFRRV